MNNQITEFKDFDEELIVERESDEEFDPRIIDISVEQQNIDYLIGKLEDEEIDLNPEFQRSPDLWKDDKKSRLIESLMVRFPLPGFYFDITDKNNWQVVDGLQRLSSLKKFVIDNKLKLQKLDFLKEIEGKYFEDLSDDKIHKHLIRTMRRTQIVLYLIRPGTPKPVKYRLYERINTGGLKLNSQEIRHALNQGKSADYVKKLADQEKFKKVMNISKSSIARMLDRELALRYIAFRETPYNEYKPTLTGFLDKAMEKISFFSEEYQQELKQDFIESLKTANELFGENIFRNFVNQNAKFNRALFETWTVVLSQLTYKKRKVIG